MDAVRRAVTIGTAFSLGSILATRGIGFLTSLLLARALGPNSLGEYSILIGFHSVTVLLAGCGLTLIAPKLVAELIPPGGPAPPEAHRAARSLSGTIGLLGVFTAVVAVLASPFLSLLIFGHSERWPLLAVTGAAVGTVVWSATGTSLLQGLHGIRRLAVLNVAVALTNLVLVLPAARLFGVAGAVGALGVSHAAFALLLFLSLPPAARAPLWNPDRPLIRRGLELGLPLLIGSLVVPLVAFLARTALGRMSGMDEVGHYQVGETLNQAVLFFPMALSVPIYPVVSSMGRLSDEERARLVGPLLEYVALLTLPAAIVVGWGARLWVSLYGAEFAGAWPVVYILTGGFFLSSLGFVIGGVLSGLGLTLDGLLLNLTWSAIFLALALILVKPFGAAGLAVAYSAAYAVYTVILAIYLHKRIRVKLFNTWRTLAAAGVIFATGWFLLPRMSPFAAALAAIPAILLAAASGWDQWRKALPHIRSLVDRR